MSANAPTDPKVIVAGLASGFSGAVIVLLMNLINKEPLDQVAIETVISGVVAGLFGYVGGWLKTTPYGILAQRFREAGGNPNPPTPGVPPSTSGGQL
jgi:VIT1/CCC1 family predicted Fe2+/Mn2+ transporter